MYRGAQLNLSNHMQFTVPAHHPADHAYLQSLDQSSKQQTPWLLRSGSGGPQVKKQVLHLPPGSYHQHATNLGDQSSHHPGCEQSPSFQTHQYELSVPENKEQQSSKDDTW